jgi:anti-sigma factor RsiW
MSELLARARFRRDHRWAPRHMSDYLDGDLAAHGRRRIESHLADCRECRRLLAGLGRLLDALHRLPVPAGDPVAIVASVRNRLQEPPEPG